jgi:hypothetical protein
VFEAERPFLCFSVLKVVKLTNLAWELHMYKCGRYTFVVYYCYACNIMWMREVNHVKRFMVTFCSNYSIQHYVIKFVRDLRQVGGFLRVLRFPLPIKLTTRYNWNIVERGVKYHLYEYIYFPRIKQICKSIYIKKTYTSLNVH